MAFQMGPECLLERQKAHHWELVCLWGMLRAGPMVLECQSGKSISAIKNVSINEPFFNGHFPHFSFINFIS